MKQKINTRISSMALIFFLIASSFYFLFTPKVEAAALTSASVYLNTLSQSQVSGATYEIILQPAAASTSGSLIIVFPDADDGDWCRSAGSLTTATTSLKESALALPGTLSASCTQGSGASNYDTITITGMTAIVNSNKYGVRISGNVGALGTSESSTTGIITVKTNSGSDVDTGYAAVDIITSDEISISGRVDPTLTFGITDSSIGFGIVTAAAVRYATADEVGSASEPAGGAPSQLSVSTNADDGAVIEIRDTNTNSASGMYSAGTGTTLVSVASTAVSLGSEEFGIYGKNGSSVTIAEGFDNDSNADAAITTTFQTFATVAGPVSSATVDVAPVAAVSAATPAGNYADTIYVVATGKF